MIVPGNKFILAVLNSRLGDWYIRQLGVTRNGGYFEYKPESVELFNKQKSPANNDPGASSSTDDRPVGP